MALAFAEPTRPPNTRLGGKPDGGKLGGGKLGGKSWALLAFVLVQVLSVTLLQKFGLPVGGDVMEIAVFTSWIGVGLLALNGMIGLDPVRLLLFCAFAVTAISSQLLGGQPFSVNSVFLALALYAPFVLRFYVEPALYRRCMDIFLNVMLVAGGLVVLQQLMQLTVGWRAWPDLDKLAPQQFLFSGYNYLQPVAFGSPWEKPNAFLFLEVSFVSQFTAIALMIELALRQRLLRMVFYAVVLLISFAGTGLLLLAVCAPLVLTKLSPRMLITLGLLVLVAAIVAGAIGWYDQVSHRFGEIGTAGSSGYYRFNVPFQIVGDMAGDPRFMFTGHGAGSTGAGQSQNVAGFILVPFAKIIYEYGFLTFFAFYAFLIYCLFAEAPSLLIAFALFMFFNLGGGGFVVPVYVVTCQVLGALLRVQPERRPDPARRRFRRGRPEPGAVQASA